ncbi:MAG: PilN domain-containing protein [Thermoflexales bacterium]|nr:PilN domain-containing protein [Thermoflexales bacterium]
MGKPTGKTGKPASSAAVPPPSGPTAKPKRPAPRGVPRNTLILWLVAAGLAFFFVPLVLVNNAIRTDTQRITADLNSAISQINTVPTPVPAIEQLSAQLTEVQSQTQQIAAANQQLNVVRPDWPAIMAALGRYDPNILQIEALNSGSNRLTLSGRAVDQNAVVNYARTLEQSTLFNRVNVQSIRVLATPLVTGTPTLVGTGSVGGTTPLSGTVEPRDEYEPDNTDVLARPISIGSPQLHNFYPGLDVDTETFLAKSGRYYRITTSDLTPGVDTFISISVGDRVYINDDAKPGTLASELSFQNTQVDVIAIIRTTNRGQYGIDKRYQLSVEEVVPTLTPTPGPAATTAAATLVPTSTVAPTATSAPTATPVPDLRDAYESDETLPKPIAIAQSQLHNFYPEGDFDQVQFLVKSGRFYRLYTTDLAMGVDTFMTIGVGTSIYTNDDAKPGMLASDLTFSVTGGDVIATARITNRGQFGPDKQYQLVLEEFVPTPTPVTTSTPVPFTPTPTPSATPSPTPSPTPDLRDTYEPDGATPAPIAVNGSQARNFYPSNDTDQIVFMAKANRYYTIQTSNLALGVDTFITTTQGGGAWINDDYATAPAGAYASMLCITATIDGPAVTTIANKDLFFGPSQTYSVTVNEVASPPAPCAPTTPLNIIPASSSINGGQLLSAGLPPINVIRLVPTINWLATTDRAVRPSSGLLTQASAPEFFGVEFVIIVELKVSAP